MDKPEVFEIYGWDFEKQDYFLYYRGTDEKEAKRVQRSLARAAKKEIRRRRQDGPGQTD